MKRKWKKKKEKEEIKKIKWERKKERKKEWSEKEIKKERNNSGYKLKGMNERKKQIKKKREQMNQRKDKSTNNGKWWTFCWMKYIVKMFAMKTKNTVDTDKKKQKKKDFAYFDKWKRRKNHVKKGANKKVNKYPRNLMLNQRLRETRWTKDSFKKNKDIKKME